MRRDFIHTYLYGLSFLKIMNSQYISLGSLGKLGSETGGRLCAVESRFLVKWKKCVVLHLLSRDFQYWSKDRTFFSVIFAPFVLTLGFKG